MPRKVLTSYHVLRRLPTSFMTDWGAGIKLKKYPIRDA